jgi:hypothetical protein
MLARYGQRLSPCSLFVLTCQACSHRQTNVEYFGGWLWITFWDSRGAMPWKAIMWCTVAVVLMTIFVILNLFQDLTSHVEIVRSWNKFRMTVCGMTGYGMTGGGRQGCGDEGGPSSCLRAFVRETLAQRLVWAGLCVRALWARAHPARPFALSGVYRTCHRNSAIAKIARKRSRFISKILL